MTRFPKSVSTQLLQLLRQLAALPSLKDFALRGGTSLSLRFGHRSSVDIDLFSTTPFDTEIFRNAVFTAYPESDLVNRTTGSLCVFIHGIKVDLLHHPYPLLFETTYEQSIPFISIPDIAAMKINAVTKRGSKKDFSDLLLLHEPGISLSQSLDHFVAKFGPAGRFLAVRSLAWFEDAEQEPDPRYLNGWTWQRVRNEMTVLGKALIA